MSIEKLRQNIDNIDSKILRLLNKRAEYVQKIGEKKAKRNLSYYSPARERQIISRLVKENKGPLPDLAIKTIFREILSSCLALEKMIRVVYLGPAATFTHQACLEKFGSAVECISQTSIPDVFHYVEKNLADYGVVPIENSVEGRVSHTLDMFIHSDLKVCAEIYLNISHFFLSSSSHIKEVKKVYSNPQAFSQCKQWIKNNLSDSVEIIEVSSTSRAAEIVSCEKNTAAIASKLAAEIYNLNILAENIEDNPSNRTRFLVIGQDISDKSGKDKTSFMFSVRHRAGALYRALAPLDKYKVNMTMIESRPTGQKLWEYVFFIDVQGYYTDENVVKALSLLEKECLFLKILGSYPETE